MAGGGEAPNLEAYVADRAPACTTISPGNWRSPAPTRARLIGQAIIDAIDENGYLREELLDIAARLDADPVEAEAILATIQGFDPSGVGARDLAECLAIQLREKDRYDPAMRLFVANLPLLAKRDFAHSPGCAASTPKTSPIWRPSCAGSIPSPAALSAARPIQPLVADVIVRPRERRLLASSNSTPTPCRAFWSTTAMRPGQRRGDAATATKPSSRPVCKTPTG